MFLWLYFQIVELQKGQKNKQYKHHENNPYDFNAIFQKPYGWANDSNFYIYLFIYLGELSVLKTYMITVTVNRLFGSWEKLQYVSPFRLLLCGSL